MKDRILTCIVCPKGCELTVRFDERGEIENISGHTCRRGEGYARTECISPARTVTTTVRCECGEVVSVKTSRPVPKSLVFEVMEAINDVVAPDRVKIGDVIIANVCGTDADVVATSNKF